MTIDEILKEIKKRPHLNEKETAEFISYLDTKKINEGDAGLLGGLNASAFSVRKKNFKIPRRIRIFVELIIENGNLWSDLKKVKDALRD